MAKNQTKNELKDTLLRGAATRQSATVSPDVIETDEAPATTTRKRSPKIEVVYRGRIYLCSGEKGGVGKTLTARSLIEILRRAGFLVMPIEADAGNRDIETLFDLSKHLNLQHEGGYVNFLNHLQSIPPQYDVVVSLPGGVLAGAEVRGEFFLEALGALSEELNREVITVWPIDDKVTSVEMLANFVEKCPNARLDVVQNSFFFDRFDVFERSNTKRKIEEAHGKILKLPRLKPEVMQRLVNESLGFDEALKIFPIGHKYEFQHWLRRVTEVFREAGYLDRASADE